MKVVVADQAGGLIAACDCPNPKLLPGVQLQHCNWHTVKAIKAKYRKSNYSSSEIEKLAGLSQAYIDSKTEDQLTVNRIVLVSALKALEKAYIFKI